MRICGMVLAAVCAADVSAQSRFSGELVLEPAGCQAIGRCISRNALRFTDSDGVVWEAEANLPTDGASIPPVFQAFVGEPFEARFVKAAIVHDHYCRRNVRPWRQTHRAFYEGLLDQGVPEGRAKLMYYAVYLAGPRWVKLVPGRDCGRACINAVLRSASGPTFVTREARYDRPDLPADLKELEADLERYGSRISIEEIERRADAKDPSDFYLQSGESVFATDAMF